MIRNEQSGTAVDAGQRSSRRRVTRVAARWSWGRRGTVIGASVVMALLMALSPADTYAAYGGNDTYYGSGALANESNGDFNTAFGANALNANTSGRGNTAIGSTVLEGNNASDNTGTGSGRFRHATDQFKRHREHRGW